VDPQKVQNDKDFLKELAEVISRLEKIQFLHLALLFVVVIAIPFTVYLTQQKQDLRQNAQELVTPTNTPTPSLQQTPLYR